MPRILANAQPQWQSELSERIFSVRLRGNFTLKSRAASVGKNQFAATFSVFNLIFGIISTSQR